MGVIHKTITKAFCFFNIVLITIYKCTEKGKRLHTVHTDQCLSLVSMYSNKRLGIFLLLHKRNGVKG